MRTTVDQRLSLTPDERKELHDLAGEMDLGYNRTVARAIRGLRFMWADMKLRAEVAGPERGELLLRIARELGPGELLNKEVTDGELKDDGRPAIGTSDPLNDQEAIFYVDERDRLVMQLRRGEVVDHFLVSDGHLVLPDPDREATAVLN